MPHSASSLPPRKRHSRLTIVRRGYNRWRFAGAHGEAMYTAPDCAACAALQAANSQCAGSRGKAPCVLLGDLKGAILSRERMAPFIRTPARRRGIPSQHGRQSFENELFQLTRIIGDHLRAGFDHNFPRAETPAHSDDVQSGVQPRLHVHFGISDEHRVLFCNSQRF